jgi:methylated-DNA-[protein]-cysteine S-methyltransferase
MRDSAGLEEPRDALRAPEAAPPGDYVVVVATPWPALKLGVRADHRAVIAIDFLPGEAEERRAASPLAREAQRHLRDYFRDPRHVFTLPLAPAGTAFQRRVWNAMRRIPAGTPASYGDLAARLGSGARAVGGACRANPIPVIIPCHRVVGRSGLGGFMGTTAGRGLEIKQWLLAHEAEH